MGRVGRGRGAPGAGRRPGAGHGVARLRQLLVVPAVDVQPLRAGPKVLATPRNRLPDCRRVPSVCGCGTFAEAMVVDEVFSGERLAGSKVGDAQALRDFPRYVRLAEAGKVDLGSMVSRRIKLDEVNDGIESLHRAEGVRTVTV